MASEIHAGLGVLASLSSLVPVGQPSPNPSGRNQFLSCRQSYITSSLRRKESEIKVSARKDDLHFLQLLRELHKITTSAQHTSELLAKKHGISIR